MLDRAVKEPYADRCRTRDLALIRSHFRQHGAIKHIYCGAWAKRWDHLHSISKGGDTVPGNLVPACARCDDSKQQDDWQEWIGGTKPADLRLVDLRLFGKQSQLTARSFRTWSKFTAKLPKADKATCRQFRLELKRLRDHLVATG